MIQTAVIGIVVLLAASVLGLVSRRSVAGHYLVYSLCLIASIGLALGAVGHLLGGAGHAQTLVLPLGIPWVQAHFRIDELSAFFLLVINLLAAATSLYSMGYERHAEEPGRVRPFYPLFLAGMNLVLCADDAYSFLVSWEFMSLSSWLLVMSNRKDPEAPRAALVYLVMASFGTATLLFAFAAMNGNGGDFLFATMRDHPLEGKWAALVMILTLLGAGSKAGLAPMHVWLPLAHPAAPSPVSALMSGVMTKVALYGMIRILFDLLGSGPWWWGAVMMLVGGLTAVLGVLHAIMETDIKKILAYSTVENIGIIVLGLGLALVFRTMHMEAAAALAMTAALLHALNHALFKGLLFCGAGAVLHATGERNLDKLGGLIHKMPITAFLTMVGVGAACALPPYNGFVSEWLMFQAIINTPDMPVWLLRFELPVAATLLALAAALAGTVFVRLYGITFLGRARSAAVADAREPDAAMLVAMGGLAGLCMLLGVLPAIGIVLIDPATKLLVGESLSTSASVSWLTIAPVAGSPSEYSGLILTASEAVASIIPVALLALFGARRLRRSAPWDCGFPCSDPATQYSASSFAQPLRRVFGSFAFRAREIVEMPVPHDRGPARFAVELKDPAWDFVMGPILKAVEWLVKYFDRLQFLTIRVYLTLMFVALVGFLFLVAVVE